MRLTPALLLGAFLALLVGAVTSAAVRMRSTPSAESPGGMMEIPGERVENTVTLPPDHNARATYGIDPVYHVRVENQELAKRLIAFYKPKLQDVLQAELTRIHYSHLQQGDAQPRLAARLKEVVNAALGVDVVEKVTFANAMK